MLGHHAGSLCVGGREREGHLGREILQIGRQESPGGSLCAWSNGRAGGQRSSSACALKAPTLSIRQEHMDLLGRGWKRHWLLFLCGTRKGLRLKAGGLGSAQPNSECTCDLEQSPLPSWSLLFTTCRTEPWRQRAVGGVQCDFP